MSRRMKAERIVENKIGFYIHLVVYILVNSMFVLMWIYADGINSFPWFIFIMIPWAIGLVAHYVGVFLSPTGECSPRLKPWGIHSCF